LATTRPVAAVRYRQTVWRAEVPRCRPRTAQAELRVPRGWRCATPRRRPPTCAPPSSSHYQASALPSHSPKSSKLTEVCVPTSQPLCCALPSPLFAWCLAAIPTHAPSASPHERRLSACPARPPRMPIPPSESCGRFGAKTHKPKQIIAQPNENEASHHSLKPPNTRTSLTTKRSRHNTYPSCPVYRNKKNTHSYRKGPLARQRLSNIPLVFKVIRTSADRPSTSHVECGRKGGKLKTRPFG
jgi:hypothetical protein